MIIPKVTKEFETFPFPNFDSTMVLTTSTLADSSYVEYQEQGTEGYIMRISPKDTYLRIIKKFFQNGNIKEKGLSVNYGGFKKGIWYYYDEQGNLLKEENHDLPFAFSFEDLILYLQKDNIPLTLGYDNEPYYHTRIYNDVDASRAIWIVEWLKKGGSPNIVEKIIIDGKTGKVLEKKENRLKRG